MAKQYIDIALEDDNEGLAVSSGAALTLTNDVRVLYDDAISPGDLYVVLTRARDKLVELHQKT